MGCEGLECTHRNPLWFPPISLSSSTPLSLLPLQWGCSVGITLNTSPQSEGVGCRDGSWSCQAPLAVVLSSLLLALGQRVPVQWKHFQWECLGPGQAARSHLLGIYNPSSPMSSPPWCWADTSVAAATTAMLLGWGWDWGRCSGARMGPWLAWLRLHRDLFPRLVLQPQLGLGCQWVPMPPLPMARRLLGAALPPHACHRAPARLQPFFSETNSCSSQPC